MMKSKYNKFILSVITDDTSILFDTTNDILEYSVPFGDYKIGDHITEDDWKLFEFKYYDYVKNHNIQVLNFELVDHDSETDLYWCLFTYDNNYYRVPLEKYDYYGWETEPDWLEEDLTKYQVFPKTVTKIVYE